MIVPDKLIVKQQNFSIICKGNDIKYHSNQYEYDYIKNALDFATKILKQQINKNPNYQENAACFLIKENIFLIMYINKKNKKNPYFAIYNTKTKKYSIKANVEDFESFRNHTKSYFLLQNRIEKTLFMERELFPGLLEYMSNLADDYDNEIELDN